MTHYDLDCKCNINNDFKNNALHKLTIDYTLGLNTQNKLALVGTIN